MQMFETISVMIVLLLLLVFGLIIYGQNKGEKIKEKGETYRELDLVELAQISYSLPEIQCSFAEVTDFGCIDKYKAKQLSKIINKSITTTSGYEYLYYRSIFGSASVNITIIANDGSKENFQIYGLRRNFTERRPLYMPIIIYDPVTDKNNFGVMTVEKLN